MGADPVEKVCERLAVTPFDPRPELSPDVEQFLRVNLEAHSEQLPRYLAHVIREAFAAGQRDWELRTASRK